MKDARKWSKNSQRTVAAYLNPTSPSFASPGPVNIASMETVFSWLGIGLLVVAIVAMLWNDRLRLMRPSVRVQGEVIGHRTGMSDGDTDYAAIYRFTADSTVHEVADGIYTAIRRPDVGTIRVLHYPQGRPDLARPPRLAFWIAVYTLLAAMAAVLFAKLVGWIV